MYDHRVAFPVLLLTAALVSGHVGTRFTAGPPEGKIVNGTAAKPGQFPFIISLQNYGRHSCGGAIVNENFIVTAAHCVEGTSVSGLSILAGTNTLNNGGQRHDAKAITIHEKYDPGDSWKNDIALVELKTQIILGDNVKKTSLPPQNYDTPAGTPATVIGWGYPYTGGTIMNNLQYVGIKVYSDQECDNIHDLNIYDTNICAGVPEGGKGQCSGDSGGPLVAEGYHVGIVSWSVKPCTVAPYPGVYTQVSKFTDWIKKNAQ